LIFETFLIFDRGSLIDQGIAGVFASSVIGTSRASSGRMTPDDMKARTKKFAVDVIRFAKAIPRDYINDEIASQLTDAATSTAAHYRASCRARSRADFINKLAGGIEEVDDKDQKSIITNDSIIKRSTNQQSAGHLFGSFCFNSSVQLRTTLNVESAEPCSDGSLIARNRWPSTLTS
jgi:four helix bundle protein